VTSCSIYKVLTDFGTFIRNNREHGRLTCLNCLARHAQDRQRRTERERILLPLAFSSCMEIKTQSYHGTMSTICENCTALHWIDEKIQGAGSTIEHSLFNSCCSKGDVVIPYMQPLPPFLHSFFYDDTTLARHFRTHIRKYNSTLAFVSLQYQPDHRTHGGLQCFQIHGALYHREGPLEHGANVRPQFAQIFLYDPEDAISQIRQRPGGYVLPSVINIILLQQLLKVLHEHNPYIHLYRTAHERLQQAIRSLPANEVRLLLNPRMELVLDQGRDSRSSSHAAYTPLHYVLFFPFGDHGWNWSLRLRQLCIYTVIPHPLGKNTPCRFLRHRPSSWI